MTQPLPVDEIAEFKKARYMGPVCFLHLIPTYASHLTNVSFQHEAFWHIYELGMFQCSHSFIYLPIHRLGGHQVMFNAEMDVQATDDVYDAGDQSDDGNPDEPTNDDTGGFNIVPSPDTRLTMYYAQVTAEAKEEEDAVAQNISLRSLSHKFGPRATELRYVDFPFYYSYTNKAGWKRKIKRDYGKTIVRVHGVPGKDAELWYLRLLLNNVKGVRSQQHLLDAVLYNGTRCITFQQACIARGLAQDDREWYQCLFEASRVDGKCGKSLRTLYTSIFAFCSPSDPVGLFHAFKDDFSDDFAYIRNHDQQSSSILSVDHYRALLWIHEKLTNDMSQPALVMGCLTNLLNEWNKEDKAIVDSDGPQMRAVSTQNIYMGNKG